MPHFLYISAANTVGVEEYLSFHEIGPDGTWLRYLHIAADGCATRYTESHAADEWGALPEGVWDVHEAAKPAYGTLTAISAQLFDAVWRSTRCKNAEQGASMHPAPTNLPAWKQQDAVDPVPGPETSAHA